MCLPFCCRENDPPQGDGVGHTPSSGTGKGSNKGNGGANMTKNESDDDKNKPANSPHTPPPPQSHEDSNTEEEVSSPTPAALQDPPRPSPKHRDQLKAEETAVAARSTPTAVTKAPKNVEKVVAASPIRHAGPVALAAAGVADSSRTPPETQQIARRGHAHDEDHGYSNPSPSPTVVAVPAANNFRGDRGHGDAHAHSGKDDRKTPGRTRW